jgi:hypothetical protein
MVQGAGQRLPHNFRTWAKRRKVYKSHCGRILKEGKEIAESLPDMWFVLRK